MSTVLLTIVFIIHPSTLPTLIHIYIQLPITAAAAFFASAAGDLKEIGHPTTAPPLAKLEGNSAGDIKESDGPMKVRKARASKRTNAPSTTCVATELAGMRQLEHSVDTCR